MFRVAIADRDLPTPTPLLKLPAKPGDKWEWEQVAPGGTGVVTTVFTVGKPEQVEVPAGKFEAIPVEHGTDLRGRTVKATTWHAPGVGVVKMVTYSGASERTQVLKSIRPGK